VKKLRLLKAALCIWNKEVFGDVNRRLAKSLDDLQRVQHEISVNGFLEDLYTRTTEIKVESDLMLSRQELLNKEKSHIKWLEEED